MKVGLLGYGTVGRGVYQCLCELESRGLPFHPGLVLRRKGKADQNFMTDDFSSILSDPGTDVVCEVMGGIDPAYEYIKAALENGKHVVTANKALIAGCGIELDGIARRNNVALLFSAACGGGVPVLHNLQLSAETDSVSMVRGILNGTTNYMLDSMHRQRLSYADSLSQAQAMGLAEADPSADVSGLDALRKIVLASAVAFDRLPQDGMLCEGIEDIDACDIAFAEKRGFVCRLIASAVIDKDSVSCMVQPTLFDQSSPFAGVGANDNLIQYESAFQGKLSLGGQGAGSLATASAVLRDLQCIMDGKLHMLGENCRACSSDVSSCEAEYFVSLVPKDQKLLEKEFVLKQSILKDGRVYAFTEKTACLKMFEFAKRMRENGRRFFFAAMG